MRNAGIAMGLVVMLFVVFLVTGKQMPSSSTPQGSGADETVAVELEFKAEKGERQSYGAWAGMTWHYFRVTSANQQPVKLARIIVNDRTDQPECVVEYENQTLRMGDKVSKDVDTTKCGDIMQVTIVTADPPGEFTYKF